MYDIADFVQLVEDVRQQGGDVGDIADRLYEVLPQNTATDLAGLLRQGSQRDVLAHARSALRGAQDAIRDGAQPKEAIFYAYVDMVESTKQIPRRQARDYAKITW